MPINIYDKSEPVRLQVTFLNIAGALTDPTTVLLTVKSPAGVKTNYTYALSEITRDSIGVYHKDVAASQSGSWYYEWEGTGPVQVVERRQFEVQPSDF